MPPQEAVPTGEECAGKLLGVEGEAFAGGGVAVEEPGVVVHVPGEKVEGRRSGACQG